MGIVQGRFLQPVVWIMESRLGVRAADAKTPPHYHYHVPPQPHHLRVRTSACLQYCSAEHCCAAAGREGAGVGWGQRDRRHLNHWSGSPLDRSVCALRCWL